jgi:hypothetical protein
MTHRLIACLWLALVTPLSGQIVVTDVISVADSFVRSVDPTHNYGGAGALAVSGSTTTNVLGQQEGLLDSFMRFDASSVISNLNSSLGTGRWVIVSATLNLFEQGAPNNPIFNRGVGPFEVRWIVTNSWSEGTGNPNAPTTDGVVWNDEPNMLHSNLDESLGTFTNGGTDGVVKASLGMPAGFVNEFSSVGLVSFYFTATTSSPVGFTFHSHNFVDSTQWPFLEITAISMPQITSLVVTGSNIKINFTAVGGVTNAVEYKNDLLVGSWSTLTNITGISGNVTAIDSGAAALPKRFYRVRVTIVGD